MKKVPKRVILTREEEDIERDRKVFEGYGFEVVSLPLIRSEGVPFEDNSGTFDWVVFQSVRAVRFFLERAEIPSECKIAVVGEKTKNYLESLGYRVDFVPEDQSAEGLSKELPLSGGERVLIPRSSIGRETLLKGLKERGCDVVDLVVYRVEVERHSPEKVRGTLAGGGFIVFASPSAVKGLFANLQREEILNYLRNLVVVAIGKTTKNYLESEGVTADIIPTKPLMEEVAVKIHTFWHEFCTL